MRRAASPAGGVGTVVGFGGPAGWVTKLTRISTPACRNEFLPNG